MPVVNYKHTAEVTKKRVLNNPAISQKNKEALKRFLNAYDVSPARESIFLNNIQRLLTKTLDILKDMNKPDLINKIFKEFRQNFSPATFETIKNVSNRFVRWLNNGEKPQGFKDIKSVKANQKRDLEPKDMITWEDGLKLVSFTNSLQIKAALLTQLDAGFRPSEFIDLKYGDVQIKDDIVVFNVKGKTGKRSVWIHRAVPYFLRWFDSHPFKTKDSPLWILENSKRDTRSSQKGLDMLRKYTYKALQSRFETLKEKAVLEKPIDFYNLRHSSCVLDKMDNVPEELAAERHGHSIEFYTKTYGRLSVEDTLNRVKQHYGKPEEKKELVKNLKCGRCQAVNEPGAEFCRVCGVPLTVKQAASVYSEREELKGRMDKFEAILKGLDNKKVNDLIALYDKLEKRGV